MLKKLFSFLFSTRSTPKLGLTLRNSDGSVALYDADGKLIRGDYASIKTAEIAARRRGIRLN